MTKVVRAVALVVAVFLAMAAAPEQETVSAIVLPWNPAEDFAALCSTDPEAHSFRPPVILERDNPSAIKFETVSETYDVDLLAKIGAEQVIRVDGHRSSDGAVYTFALPTDVRTAGMIQYVFVLEYEFGSRECGTGGTELLPPHSSFRSVVTTINDLDVGEVWDATTQTAAAQYSMTGTSIDDAADICAIEFAGPDPCLFIEGEEAGEDAGATEIRAESAEVRAEGEISTLATCKTVTKTTPNYWYWNPGGYRSPLSLTTTTGDYNWPEDEAYQYTSARAVGGSARATGLTRLGYLIDVTNPSSSPVTMDVVLDHRMYGRTEAISYNYDQGAHPFHVDPRTDTDVRYRSGSKVGANANVYSANFYSRSVLTSPPTAVVPGHTNATHSKSGSYKWSLTVPANKTTRTIVWADLFVSDYSEAPEALTMAHAQTNFDKNTSSDQWNVRTPKSTWTITSDHYWTTC